MVNTEYRFGNWVYSLIIEDYTQITGMTSDVELAVYKIKLTEDWLLNFGFAWNESWGCYMKNGYLVEKIGDLLLDRKYGKVINYVHQLQNLYFLLTDKELVFNGRK